MARTPKRGDVIAVLNRLVRSGVIASFQTRLFDQDKSHKADVSITVSDPATAGDALRQVRAALDPLGMDLTVAVDLRD